MKNNKIIILLYGILARLLGLVIPVKKRCWIFGADIGRTYREGSKYLIEYMLKMHPEYECYFVTQAKEVREALERRNIPCIMNISLRGIWITARAECVFTTQLSSDIIFAFKKPGRRFYYLVHGQPYKVALATLAKTDYAKKHAAKATVFPLLRSWLSHCFVCDYVCYDSEFVSATSEFLSKLQKLDFGENMPSRILGMPRNDALFQPERMSGEKWIGDTSGKFIVSYMPTHRQYGRGAFSPTPFANRKDVQDWMIENNVLLVVKNHPTMLLYQKNEHPFESACIKDITSAKIDPMTVLYHSDVLITDYSSVWMDYLLMRRPIIFYIYDNFVKDDVGVYYDIHDEHVGHFCNSEDELFALLKSVKANYKSMCPKDEVVQKFHKYVDGNSCERYYESICNDSKSYLNQKGIR